MLTLALSCVSTVKWVLPPPSILCTLEGSRCIQFTLEKWALGLRGYLFWKTKEGLGCFFLVGQVGSLRSGIARLVFFLGGSIDVGGACQLAGSTAGRAGRELLTIKILWRRNYSAGTSSTLAAQAHQLVIQFLQKITLFLLFLLESKEYVGCYFSREVKQWGEATVIKAEFKCPLRYHHPF